MANIHRSGDGTRPGTDGGVDNMGGAGRMPGVRDKPRERAQHKRNDNAAARQDDSAPWGMRDDPAPASNKEAPPEPEPDSRRR